MILCVDTTKIDTSPTVQKSVKLEDIVSKYTKYYDDIKEAENDRFVPLDFSVSVRTEYTNLVLQVKEKDRCKYCVNHTKVGKFVHKGYDLIMYLAAIGLMSYVNYSYAFDDMMLNSSVMQPIGLYNPDSGFVNPIVLSHIIIKDEAIDTLRSFLKPEAKLVSLDTMRRGKAHDFQALLDTLVDVKKGE